MKKLALLLVFPPLLLGLTVAWSQNAQSPSVRFIIVGDQGGFASPGKKNVAAAMGKEADRIKARFVLTVGDNFHEDGIASATDPRWQTEFEDVYSHPALQVPWYPSVGNHDYRGSVDAEIHYSRISARWRLSARYYTQLEPIDDSTSLFIVHLDTSPFIGKYRDEAVRYHMDGQDAKRQLVWLDSVLTCSPARWNVVVGHHAIYFAEPGHDDSKEMIDLVLPILRKHSVPLYVSGHYHFLQHLRRDGMDYMISGGGALTGDVAPREDIVFGIRSLGFVSVRATAESIQLEFIDQTNTVLHTVRVSTPRARERSSF